MNNTGILKQIEEELLVKNKKRILLQNFIPESQFLRELENALQESFRILVLDCTDDSTFRQSILAQFSCENSMLETSFEAGWRSHATEISIYSKSRGLEVVAGLQAMKNKIKEYLLSDTDPMSPIELARMYASYAWSLPTFLVLINFSEKNCSFLDELFSERYERVPPVIVCTTDRSSFSWADAVLISDLMSPNSISQYLLINGSDLSVDSVVKATNGEIGLVKIYFKLYSRFGIAEESVFLSLDTFFKKVPEVAAFLRCAAVIGFEFIPQEVSIVVEANPDSTLTFCLETDLIKELSNRFYVFGSTSIWKYLLRSIEREEKDRILNKFVSVDHERRELDSKAYQTLAEIYIKLGQRSKAGEAFERAAILAEGCVVAAKLFKKASLFNSLDRDKLLLNSALNYYRAELYTEVKHILSQLKYTSFSSYLLGRLTNGASISIDFSTDDVNNYLAEEAEFPELLPDVLESKICYKAGKFFEAERLLLNCALKDEFTSLVCLVELGQQLYNRGLIENSLNTMMAAGNIASKMGISWLERKALFTFIKAANTIGRTGMVDKYFPRLHELTVLSGNTKKQVSVNNLYANSQLLRQNYSTALDIYSSSLKLLSSEDNAKDIELVILNNMSVAQRKLFQTDKALRTLMRQVQTAVSLGNLGRACIAYGNMARQFLDLWKPDEASDCLETMIEFAQLGGLKDVAEIINGISSMLAFMRGDSKTALELLDQVIEMARETGKRRRLSLYLLKKGSFLLRLKRYEEAVAILKVALEESQAVNSELNSFVAKSKLTASSCFLGICHPAELLTQKYSGNLDLNHKGEVMYYHWCLTGSRQSQLATAVLFSKGLSSGVSWHSYLYMLQDVASTLPASLAQTIPLLHNYPSCEQMKGQ